MFSLGDSQQVVCTIRILLQVFMYLLSRDPTDNMELMPKIEKRKERHPIQDPFSLTSSVEICVLNRYT